MYGRNDFAHWAQGSGPAKATRARTVHRARYMAADLPMTGWMPLLSSSGRIRSRTFKGACLCEPWVGGWSLVRYYGL